MNHEKECKNFAWAIRHGYIQRSEVDGSWCIQAVGTDDELLLAVYNCPYCGKDLSKHEPEPTDELEVERRR